MKITQRAAFGWGESAARTASPTRGLVVHYDGSNQGLGRKAHSACVTYWQKTRRFHMGSNRGWADIGYSFGACPHGEILEGRGLGHEQAAQPGGNTSWYSVTLMSGPDEDPTDAQIDAVRQLRSWLMSRGVGGAVRGHRDFISTSCPGDRAYALVKDGTFTGKATEEDDVSAKDNWQHELKVPYGSEDNLEWQAGNILVNNGVWLRKIAAKVDAQNATIGKLVELLGRGYPEIDVEALKGEIRAEIKAAVEGVEIRLDIVDTPT